MPSLILESGDTPKYFELSTRNMTIGRLAACEIQLLDQKVSRKHAIIVHGTAIRPFKNILNEILVNGNIITDETQLNDGDIIAIGDCVLRYSTSTDRTKKDDTQKYKLAQRNYTDAKTIS